MPGRDGRERVERRARTFDDPDYGNEVRDAARGLAADMLTRLAAPAAGETREALL